jgi:hypothetical protein
MRASPAETTLLSGISLGVAMTGLPLKLLNDTRALTYLLLSNISMCDYYELQDSMNTASFLQ